MAKRRQKTRTHKRVSEEELAQIPRSMVIRLGTSLKNHSLSQLVKDFRSMMQPHTAVKLRERKSNKLKDFIVMAGPLGVSDLFVFNQSEASGNILLRIGKMPRGPMMQFQISNYSLVKDVAKVLKHPKSVSTHAVEFAQPPLLVLNGFLNQMSQASNHEKLMVTMFQNMFPPIQPQQTKVSSIKRVLMINKNPETQEIDIRHYVIDVKMVGGSRGIRKLINSHHDGGKRLPNLSRAKDMSELLLDPYAAGALTSDSEVEDDAIVEVKDEVQASARRTEVELEMGDQTKKKAVKLTEIGPRITMSLVKIEEGLTGTSKTIYHSRIEKSDLEMNAMNKRHEARKKLRAERRAEQQKNVEFKKKSKDMKKERRKARALGEGEVQDQDNDENEANISSSSDEEDGPEINPDDYANDSDLYSDIEK